MIRGGWHVSAALIVISSVACGPSDDGGTGPLVPGSISVSTQTSGFQKDDGYEILVDGVDAGAIGANDQVMISELDPATYDVTLADVADNCTVEGTTATVTAAATTDASLSVVCSASDATPYSLRANRDRPNLEDGAITSCSFGLCPTNERWDLYVEFNSASDPQAIIRQNQYTGVEIAHLPGTSLAELTEADVAGATFTTDPVDQSFDADRVILIRTDTGSVYGLANPVESTILLTLDFDAVLLVSAP